MLEFIRESLEKKGKAIAQKIGQYSAETGLKSGKSKSISGINLNIDFMNQFEGDEAERIEAISDCTARFKRTYGASITQKTGLVVRCSSGVYNVRLLITEK